MFYPSPLPIGSGGEIKGHKQGTFVSFDFLNGKYTLNKEGKNMMILIKNRGGYSPSDKSQVTAHLIKVN